MRIDWVSAEELLFLLETFTNTEISIDILLSSVDNTNVSTLQGNQLVLEDFRSICARIHQVKLCQNTNSSVSIRVSGLSKLQSIAVGNISVCGSNSQNDCVGVRNKLKEHLVNLLLNVLWLITNRNLGHSWQIHQCQCKDTGRVDLEVNRIVADTLVVSGKTIGLSNNLFANLPELVELLTRHVQKFSPFRIRVAYDILKRLFGIF
mmetsp:Transcript_16929/g.41237  ORF Transcript_16929/g.41237 Transcript_16929/m.41237 type:complete len:206 (+) Transcript_16929:1554-2171(+)